MTCELNQNDLVNLVKGTEPSYEKAKPIIERDIGAFYGGFGPEWEWNVGALMSMTESQLWSLYQFIIK